MLPVKSQVYSDQPGSFLSIPLSPGSGSFHISQPHMDSGEKMKTYPALSGLGPAGEQLDFLGGVESWGHTRHCSGPTSTLRSGVTPGSAQETLCAAGN